MLEAGSAEPVLLLHGLGLDRSMWLPLMAEWPGARLLAPNLPLHGAAAHVRAATIDEMAAHVLALAGRLGLARFGVVGFSMGGAVAQTLALAVPARVTRLSLIACVARGLPAMRARAEAAEADGMAAQIAPTLERWFTREQRASDIWPIGYARARLAAMAVPAWAAAWRALAAFDALDRLGTLPMPVHVVCGGADVSATPATMRAIADGARATFDTMADAPHALPLTHPRALAAILARHHGAAA